MKAPTLAVSAFRQMQSRSIWSLRDAHTANILLNSLSSDLPAAFSMCTSLSHDCPPSASGPGKDILFLPVLVKTAGWSPVLSYPPKEICYEDAVLRKGSCWLQRSEAKIDCLHMCLRYEEMTAAGLQPTRVTFNTLLKACMRGKDAARADDVLARMQERDCQVRSLYCCRRGCACAPCYAQPTLNTTIMTITMKNAASCTATLGRDMRSPLPRGLGLLVT